MAALPGNYPIQARVGQTFTRVFQYTTDDGTPVDLTGYRVRMPIRRNYNAELFRELTDGDGIEVHAASGEIVPTIPATDMDTIEPRVYVYDLVLIPQGDEARRFALLTGQFTVAPRVKPEGDDHG